LHESVCEIFSFTVQRIVAFLSGVGAALNFCYFISKKKKQIRSNSEIEKAYFVLVPA